MRTVRSALIVILTVLMAGFLAAAPASAGGPTSVLVVESDTRSAASLYYTDADYEGLASLVGAAGPSGIVGEVDRSGTTHEFGSGVTLTWLIHDVAVWRVDRIFLEAKGGPWISTQLVMNDSGSVYDSPVTWHTAADGPKLSALLDRVGIGAGSGASVGGDAAAVTDGEAPAPAAPPQPEASQPADTGSTGTNGLLWGLSGLALGAALTLAAVRLLQASGRVTARAVAPAPAVQDSFDQVSPGEPEDARDWSIPDELSSTSRRN